MIARRVVNFSLIAGSYLLSRVVRKPVQWGKPSAVSLEPVNRCNLHCPECPTGNREITRPQGTMTLNRFRDILEQLGPELAWVTLYFQGEPYLNPGFLEMVRVAKARNLHVITSTNGHFLSTETALETVRSGLDRLIVSLDGATQESYSAYRAGGSLERVVAGLAHLAEAKQVLGSKTPRVIVQCLLLSTNIHEQRQIRQIAKEVKADQVEFKTAQFYDFENGNPLMPEETYSRYKKSTNPRIHESTNQPSLPPCHPVTLSPKYVVKNKLRNSCFRMWSSCVVTWDGLVVPCCFDKDAAYVMGDLNQQRFNEIWKGEKYRDFRNKILKNRKSNDICRNCTQKY